MNAEQQDRTGLRIVLTVIFLGAFLAAGWEARDFRPQAQTFPMVIVGIGVTITLLMILSEVVRLWRRPRASEPEGSQEPGSAERASQWTLASRDARKALTVFGWFALLIALLVTLGSYLAVVLFIPYFLHRNSEAGLLVKVLGAVLPLAVMYALSTALGVTWPSSVIFT